MLCFYNRQMRLCDKLKNGIAIIPNYSFSERILNRGYFFSEDNFYYLTGFKEPDSLLLLDLDKKMRVLFCREKNIAKEIWDGPILGLEYGREYFDEVYSIENFQKVLESKLTELHRNTIYYTTGISSYDSLVNLTIAQYHLNKKSNNILVQDVNMYIAQMRLVKDNYELELLTKAAQISSRAHISCMNKIKSMHNEIDAEAEFLAVCYAYSERQLAYNPICAFGANACTLHYNNNSQKFVGQQMILLDCGVMVDGYASDITRTYPVTGEFSKQQQAIYEIVLEANEQAIKAIKLGNRYGVHGDVALRVIVQGLIDIGLLCGNLEDNLVQKTYKDFYMHSIGHWIGLAVHDVGGYEEEPGIARELVSGMVFTIEPGIYIRPSNTTPEKYWNIGVRIEDEISITDQGVNVLSGIVPKSVDEMLYIINGN
jgi:Xaa-Pro aminopeptidase